MGSRHQRAAGSLRSRRWIRFVGLQVQDAPFLLHEAALVQGVPAESAGECSGGKGISCLCFSQHCEAAKRAGRKSKVKRQMANVKSDGVLPFDPALRDDLHFDLPFDAS